MNAEWDFPSPRPSGTPLPQGERGETEHRLPSPLEGEGASRSEAGEGKVNRRHKEWRTELTPTLRKRAKAMRSNGTEAESILWGILRNRRFVGHKFRRQVPIGRFIVDFMCPKAMLIVELDGSQHAESTHDLVRDNRLKSLGYRILRVWNNELSDNRDGVLEAVWQALSSFPSPRPSGTPLPQGERGEVGHQLTSTLEGEGASRSEAGEGTNVNATGATP
ncbi:endonuclease domain-containing protein [Devosia sp.]|uniref:endonuclease domain-containing protein n=1 Tax=Devosia sp. TaxID=1871048 RepID=UPI0025C20FD5|nr:DUF559 domain-containing protein [Devosia sp.]